jgi:hypothetical protein
MRSTVTPIRPSDTEPARQITTPTQDVRAPGGRDYRRRMDQNTEVTTVPVDLDAPDLVSALASTLPTPEKGALVRAALARQGATLLDLRDAQQGITRRRRTAEEHAAYEERNRRAQEEAARIYGAA